MQGGLNRVLTNFPRQSLPSHVQAISCDHWAQSQHRYARHILHRDSEKFRNFVQSYPSEPSICFKAHIGYRSDQVYEGDARPLTDDPKKPIWIWSIGI